MNSAATAFFDAKSNIPLAAQKNMPAVCQFDSHHFNTNRKYEIVRV
jgi:hypothetical protein